LKQKKKIKASDHENFTIGIYNLANPNHAVSENFTIGIYNLVNPNP
jgi:hypothetical protein